MTQVLPKHNCQLELIGPYTVDWITTDGVFIKQILVRNAGTFLPQHSHQYDHTSMIAKGAVFVWKDGKLDQQYRAPAAVLIQAGVKHLFQTLVDDTIIYCIHNLHNEKMVKILAEHDMSEYVIEGVS